jgi:hypothetical protein
MCKLIVKGMQAPKDCGNFRKNNYFLNVQGTIFLQAYKLKEWVFRKVDSKTLWAEKKKEWGYDKTPLIDQKDLPKEVFEFTKKVYNEHHQQIKEMEEKRKKEAAKKKGETKNRPFAYLFERLEQTAVGI